MKHIQGIKLLCSNVFDPEVIFFYHLVTHTYKLRPHLILSFEKIHLEQCLPSDDLPVMLVIVLDAMYYHNVLCKNHNALPAWHNTDVNKEQNFE